MELIIVKGSNFYIKAIGMVKFNKIDKKIARRSKMETNYYFTPKKFKKDRIHIDAYKDKQGYEWVSNNFS